MGGAMAPTPINQRNSFAQEQGVGVGGVRRSVSQADFRIIEERRWVDDHRKIFC